MSLLWVYHEQQVAALCGQHCLNNLLQCPMFSPDQLAEIAQQLDATERALMFEGGTETSEAVAFAAEESGNVDESGNFSVSVLAEALKRATGLMMLPLNTDAPEVLAHPLTQEGFVCNLAAHWFAIRPVHGQWFNLNSTLKRPQRLGELYLSEFLTQLQVQGYSIHVIKGGRLPPPPMDRVGPSKFWHLLSDLLKPAPAKPKKTKKTAKQHSGWSLAGIRSQVLGDGEHDEDDDGGNDPDDDTLAVALALSAQQTGPQPSHELDEDPELAMAIALSRGSSFDAAAAPPAPREDPEDRAVAHAIALSRRESEQSSGSTRSRAAAAAPAPSAYDDGDPDLVMALELSRQSTSQSGSQHDADPEDADMLHALELSRNVSNTSQPAPAAASSDPIDITASDEEPGDNDAEFLAAIRLSMEAASSAPVAAAAAQPPTAHDLVQRLSCEFDAIQAAATGGAALKLALRLPTGTRVIKSFCSSCPVSCLFTWAQLELVKLSSAPTPALLSVRLNAPGHGELPCSNASLESLGIQSNTLLSVGIA